MTDVLERLDGLLEAERRALLDGDIAAVAELAEEKRRLAETLAKATPAPGQLRRIGEKTARNQALIAAALEGTRSAARRAHDTREVQASLTTYDASGRRTRVPSGRGGLAHKA